MMGQLLPMMLLVLVHGLMGWHGVVVRKLGDRWAVHQALNYQRKKRNINDMSKTAKLELTVTRVENVHAKFY